jgi:hypothetical protein
MSTERYVNYGNSNRFLEQECVDKSACNVDKAGYGNWGSSNRLRYDECAYQKSLKESVSPLMYQLYDGKFENVDKCMYEKQFWRPFDLVDIETELKNISRPNSKCPERKYSPTCKKSNCCLSTADNNSVVFAPEICPIVHSNIGSKYVKSNGYTVPQYTEFIKSEKK